MKTLIVGDLHGNWGQLNKLITKKNPDYVLQVGDFGWWPSLECYSSVLYGRKSWILEGIKSNIPILFCDGNHEEFPSLLQMENPLYKDVCYMRRGHVVCLDGERVILFMGGASSVDKAKRIPGKDWFPEENISEREFDLAMSYKKVDIVISHTCPEEFDMQSQHESKIRDSNRIALSAILDKYKPSQWFFGHWHTYKSGQFDNTKWTCLDYPDHDKQWWTWLD